MVATIPHEMNHMPKPPIEVYPLFAIVAVIVSGGTWLAYQKMAHDKGVVVTQPRWDSHFHDGQVFPVEGHSGVHKHEESQHSTSVV
jgi:hypothetical protein